MVQLPSIIETGVDKLVNLINLKGRLSSVDASKELGVSTTVVMEWADFLEEEGIINVEYKFTKPFLVARKLGKKDAQERAKEFSGKKEVFIRKAEVSIGFLNKEAEKLNSIKVEFDKIKKELGFDINSVKNELEELKKYETLKIDLDRKIQEQKKNSLDRIRLMERQILRERKKYQDIISDLSGEEKFLEKEKEEAKSLEESEKLVKYRLLELRSTIKKVEDKVQKEEEDVQLSEKHIQQLYLLAQNMKERVQKEKEMIDPLIKESQVQAKKIEDLQDHVIKKIGEKEKKLKGAEKASSKFKILFKKKMGVLDLIEKINMDRNELQLELTALIKKAKSFQLSSKSGNLTNQIADLEKKFGEVDVKKKLFENELKKLGNFFK
jgi:chromosome segregation ATPase